MDVAEISLRTDCPKCNGTGVIDTGNNDLPCGCPAGDGAVFNVAGRGQVNGSTLKQETEAALARPLPDYLR
jgi:DnaJ-class molecular chaperone